MDSAITIRDEILKDAVFTYQSTDEYERWANALLILRDKYELEHVEDFGEICANMFALGYCAPYIAYHVDRSLEDVCQIMWTKGIPIPVSFRPITLEFICDECSHDEIVNKNYSYDATRVKGLQEQYGFIVPCVTRPVLMDKEAVMRMLKDGYSIAGIAIYCNTSAYNVIRTVMPDETSYNAEMMAEICYSWIHGKSITFISMSFDIPEPQVVSMINKCGYPVFRESSEIHDYNIHTVNAAIIGDKGEKLTLSPFCNNMPNLCNITEEPELSTRDLEVVKTLSEKKNPDEAILTAIGLTKDNYRDFICDFLVRLATKGEIIGGYCKRSVGT